MKFISHYQNLESLCQRKGRFIFLENQDDLDSRPDIDERRHFNEILDDIFSQFSAGPEEGAERQWFKQLQEKIEEKAVMKVKRGFSIMYPRYANTRNEVAQTELKLRAENVVEKFRFLIPDIPEPDGVQSLRSNYQRLFQPYLQAIRHYENEHQLSLQGTESTKNGFSGLNSVFMAPQNNGDRLTFQPGMNEDAINWLRNNYYSFQADENGAVVVWQNGHALSRITGGIKAIYPIILNGEVKGIITIDGDGDVASRFEQGAMHFVSEGVERERPIIKLDNTGEYEKVKKVEFDILEEEGRRRNLVSRNGNAGENQISYPSEGAAEQPPAPVTQAVETTTRARVGEEIQEPTPPEESPDDEGPADSGPEGPEDVPPPEPPPEPEPPSDDSGGAAVVPEPEGGSPDDGAPSDSGSEGLVDVPPPEPESPEGGPTDGDAAAKMESDEEKRNKELEKFKEQIEFLNDEKDKNLKKALHGVLDDIKEIKVENKKVKTFEIHGIHFKEGVSSKKRNHLRTIINFVEEDENKKVGNKCSGGLRKISIKNFKVYRIIFNPDSLFGNRKKVLLEGCFPKRNFEVWFYKNRKETPKHVNFDETTGQWTAVPLHKKGKRRPIFGVEKKEEKGYRADFIYEQKKSSPKVVVKDVSMAVEATLAEFDYQADQIDKINSEEIEEILKANNIEIPENIKSHLTGFQRTKSEKIIIHLSGKFDDKVKSYDFTQIKGVNKIVIDKQGEKGPFEITFNESGEASCEGNKIESYDGTFHQA